MPLYIDAPLAPLVEKLRARYPAVEVVEARLTRWPDGFLQQTIRYQAPLSELTRCGLVTKEMLRRRDRGSACGETSLGEAFHLCKCASATGYWDLDLCTESIPRDPDPFGIDQARRILAELMKFRMP